MKLNNFLAMLVPMVLAPLTSFAQETTAAPLADAMNKGDVAWMLTATLLVLFMIIPGLALFYGGLVRSKNMLSVLMQCTSIAALVMVIWVVWGYSFAFGGSTSPFWGGLEKLFLGGVTPGSMAPTFTPGVVLPEYLFIAFQMTFAAITPALIVGAFAERIRFGALMLFVAALGDGGLFPDRPHGLGCERADLCLGCDRLCRRHRGAYQRRDCGAGRRAGSWPASGVSQGKHGAPFDDPDAGRGGRSVGGLVRVQRGLEPGSERRRGAGDAEHLCCDRGGDSDVERDRETHPQAFVAAGCGIRDDRRSGCHHPGLRHGRPDRSDRAGRAGLGGVLCLRRGGQEQGGL